MSQFARQNFILFALSGIFAFITHSLVTFALSSPTDTAVMVIPVVLIFGFATVATLTAIVSRLWEMP